LAEETRVLHPIVDVGRGSRRERVGDDFTPKTSKTIHLTRKATATLQQPPGGSAQELQSDAEKTYTPQGSEDGCYQQVKSGQTWLYRANMLLEEGKN